MNFFLILKKRKLIIQNENRRIIEVRKQKHGLDVYQSHAVWKFFKPTFIFHNFKRKYKEKPIFILIILTNIQVSLPDNPHLHDYHSHPHRLNMLIQQQYIHVFVEYYLPIYHMTHQKFSAILWLVHEAL